LLISVVEAEGIEPSSRDKDVRTSTYLVYILISSFPSPVDGIEERPARFKFTYPCLAQGWASSTLLRPSLFRRAKIEGRSPN